MAKRLTELSDLRTVDPATLFTVRGGRTAASSTISRHAQLDLELWYVEQGLRGTKHKDLAEQVHLHRSQLFDMAIAELAKAKDETRVSPENPMGFKFKYEQMMYESSPLRHGTLNQAIKKDGDSKMTIWRGDYSFARAIGMALNNDVRQPSAKKVAQQRDEKHQLTNMYDDLVNLEGSAVGRQYISTTSDLSLLVGMFADSEKSQTVSVGSLPHFLKERLFAWVDSQSGEMSDEEREAARKEGEERGRSVIPGPYDGAELRELLGVPGTILTLRAMDKDARELEIAGPRKTFRIVVEKKAMLPGSMRSAARCSRANKSSTDGSDQPVGHQVRVRGQGPERGVPGNEPARSGRNPNQWRPRRNPTRDLRAMRIRPARSTSRGRRRIRRAATQSMASSKRLGSERRRPTARGPNARGTTPSERLGDLSGWEPLLRSVAKDHYAVDKHGVPVFDGGASSDAGRRTVRSSIERAQPGARSRSTSSSGSSRPGTCRRARRPRSRVESRRRRRTRWRSRWSAARCQRGGDSAAVARCGSRAARSVARPVREGRSNRAAGEGPRGRRDASADQRADDGDRSRGRAATDR